MTEINKIIATGNLSAEKLKILVFKIKIQNE